MHVGVQTGAQLSNASESINITFPVVLISKQKHKVEPFLTYMPSSKAILSPTDTFPSQYCKGWCD